MSIKNKNEIFDVIIIGAGPAGCSSALELSDKKFKVLILEKSKLSREKVCGDGIIDDTIEILNHFNIYKDFLKISEKINSLNIYFKKLEEKFKVNHFTCERKIFDKFLQKKVTEKGIKIKYDTKVDSIVNNENNVEIKIGNKTLLSKHVILATGYDYSLAKSLNFKFEENNSFFAIRNYCENSFNLKGYNFYFFKNIKGYCWAFPIKNGKVNFGIYYVEKTKEINKHMEEFISFMEKKYSTKLKLLDRTKGALLRTDLKTKEFSKGNIFLVGENANTTYGLSGEGIGKAMLSGILASKNIIDKKNLKLKNNKSYGEVISKLKKRYLSYRLLSFCLYKISFNFLYLNKIKFFKKIFKKNFLIDIQKNFLK